MRRSHFSSAVAFVLLLAMMMTSLFACAPTADDRDEAETTTTEAFAGISVAELDHAQIVYPADMETVYAPLAQSLADDIKEYCSKTIEVVSDAQSVAAVEIVLSACAGREVGETEALRTKSYSYTLVGESIFVFAGSEQAMQDAISSLSATVKASLKKNQNAFFEESMNTVFLGEYEADEVLLFQKPITDYKIVYSSAAIRGEIEMAELLAAYISDLCGWRLPVVDEWDLDGADVPMICVGSTIWNSDDIIQMEFNLQRNCYCWFRTADRVTLFSNSKQGYSAGIEGLMENLSMPEEGSADLSFAHTLTGREEDSLYTMSYNIYYADLRPERMARVVEMIQKYNPDTIGLQEVTPEWRTYLIEAMGDTYAFVGLGRDGGNYGEHNPIMYRKDKFTLIAEDTLWMSATPLVPSKFSESSLNRIFTYAVLQRNSDSKIFVHINTHLEHKSSEARVKQVGVLKQQIADANLLQYPMILTGDMNSKVGSSEISKILEIGFFNSADLAEEKIVANTHSGGTTIDFCFLSSMDFDVFYYAVDTHQYNGIKGDPSDHFPVFVNATFK